MKNSAKICNMKNLWYDIYISKEEILPIHKTDSPSQFLSVFEKAAANSAAAFFRSAANSRILITNTKKKGAKK